MIEVIAFDPGQQELAAPECGTGKRTFWSIFTHTICPFADWLSNLRLQRRAFTSVLVALGVLAVHGVVLAPLFSASASANAPLRFGTPTVIQATLIDDRSSFTLTLPTLSRPTLQPVPVDLPSDPDLPKADPGLAALYGRYLGQIHARIDRAWVRPRSAIGAPVFRCQVEVSQDPDGTVQTVTLERCNGTSSWQQSLVQGITAASPLPAPPNPAVFAQQVILHFEAVAYAPGEPAGEYAAPRAHALADNLASIPALTGNPAALAGASPTASPQSPLHALQQLMTRPLSDAHPESRPVIALRITGSHIEVQSSGPIAHP